MNNDGVSDMVIGSNGAPGGGQTARGKIYIARLSRGPVAVTTVSEIGGSTLPLTSFDYFGSGIASPADLDGDSEPDADIDGDNTTDLVVGARGTEGEAGPRAGAAYILFLTTKAGSGVEPTMWNEYVRISNQTSTGPLEISMPLDAEAQFGRSVAVLGDTDRDLVSTLAVGAPGEANDAGGVHILSVQLRRQGTAVIAAELLTTRRLAAASPVADENFGYSVAWMPGVTSSDFARLAVGAPGVAQAGLLGSVYVMDALGGGVLSTITSPQPVANALFGTSVALAPDYDGNGVRELLVGAPGEPEGGATYLLYMPRPTGSEPYRRYTPSQLGYSAAIPIGMSVSTIGLLNDDLVPDIAFGVPNNGGNAGGVVLAMLKSSNAPPSSPPNAIDVGGQSQTVMEIVGVNWNIVVAIILLVFFLIIFLCVFYFAVKAKGEGDKRYPSVGGAPAMAPLVGGSSAAGSPPASIRESTTSKRPSTGAPAAPAPAPETSGSPADRSRLERI